MDACCLCHSRLGEPVYESPAPVSITTMFRVHKGHTRVWHCEECGHTQTEPLPDLAQFYAKEYNPLTASEEEDQMYAQRDGRKIYRTEHQVATLLEKIDLPAQAKILDYGCAKASTLKALCAQRKDIVPHVFDVGEQYRKFWDVFVPGENQAVTEVPPDWSGRFDGVISFFALEHVADPRAFVTHIRGLLREGGWLYFLVPNMFANTADFVVADHVNHFAESSLRRLLRLGGFAVLEIDAGAHNSAWVVLAEKRESLELIEQTEPVADEVRAVAEYWQGFGGRVQAFESGTKGEAAIYGSGFYGTFIHSCLGDPDRVKCFLDQNPHRHQQTLLGKHICAPEALPESVSALYIGLNPRVARDEIAAVECLEARDLHIFFP